MPSTLLVDAIYTFGSHPFKTLKIILKIAKNQF
jgi:hypothetical protein